MNVDGGNRLGPYYRWLLLALASLTLAFVIAIPSMSLPVLFDEISQELDLSLVQLGAIWGMVPLAGVVASLMSGILSDRFGVKRVISIACILAGLVGAMRGLSTDFITLAASIFLFGMISSSIPPVMPKLASILFSGRNMGLANGIITIGMATGFTLGAMLSATVVSPIMGGWRNVLFLYGGISIVFGVLWLLMRSDLGQTDSSAKPVASIPFRKSFSHVARIRNIWLFALMLMGYFGCTQGTLGYLPLYLRDSGWTPATADGALAAFNAASMAGVLPLAFLSDRLRSRKPVLLGAMIMVALGVGLLSVVDGAGVWVVVVITGIARDGFMAVLMAAIVRTEGIGTQYAGSAVGMIVALGQVGGFMSPPIGNSLVSTRPSSLPFVFWSGLAIAAIVCFFFLKREKPAPALNTIQQ